MKMCFDELGNFCKEYESEGTYAKADSVPSTVLMVRLDGRAFHSLTKNFEKPFAIWFVEVMVTITRKLVEEFDADFGYTQSDEISLAWTLKKEGSQFLFGGKYNKLNSIIASHASVLINTPGYHGVSSDKIQVFDCRSWSVPNKEVATNTIYWRQWDAVRNGINAAAHAKLGHKAIEGKGTGERLAMLEASGVMYNDYPIEARIGTFVFPSVKLVDLTPEQLAVIPEAKRPTGPVIRTHFVRENIELRKFMDYGQSYLFRETKTKEDIKYELRKADIAATEYNREAGVFK